MEVLLKTCTKCNRELPEEKFCKSSHTVSGLQSWCKDCSNEDNKRRYAGKTLEEKRAIREVDNERRRERVANGGCWTCLNQAESGKKFCQRCLDRHAVIQKRQKEKRVASGLCRECGKNPPWEHSTGYCRACLDGRKVWWRELKMAAFMAYGGPKCVCCGETILAFLNLDHIERDGAEHRKAIGKSDGYRIYGWLKRHRYPAGFQVLCWNCNCGREFNGGICPHKQQAA
jgi:hypothetical protein